MWVVGFEYAITLSVPVYDVVHVIVHFCLFSAIKPRPQNGNILKQTDDAWYQEVRKSYFWLFGIARQ